VGPNPTDRGKDGCKRSLLVEGGGWPLSLIVAAANVNDAKLLEQTLGATFIGRPAPDEQLQHLCLDKGYDTPTGEAAARAAGYRPHIRRIGEEKLDARGRRHRKARRWKVERCGSWLNGCRALLVRYAKQATNYLALAKLDCILLWYRRVTHAGGLTSVSFLR
jgi:putative transposase